MSDTTKPLTNEEKIAIRKMAIEIASKHNYHVVVGIGTLLEYANIIANYILHGELLPQNEPKTS